MPMPRFEQAIEVVPKLHILDSGTTEPVEPEEEARLIMASLTSVYLYSVPAMSFITKGNPGTPDSTHDTHLLDNYQAFSVDSANRRLYGAKYITTGIPSTSFLQEYIELIYWEIPDGGIIPTDENGTAIATITGAISQIGTQSILPTNLIDIAVHDGNLITIDDEGNFNFYYIRENNTLRVLQGVSADHGSPDHHEQVTIDLEGSTFMYANTTEGTEIIRIYPDIEYDMNGVLSTIPNERVAESEGWSFGPSSLYLGYDNNTYVFTIDWSGESPVASLRDTTYLFTERHWILEQSFNAFSSNRFENWWSSAIYRKLNLTTTTPDPIDTRTFPESIIVTPLSFVSTATQKTYGPTGESVLAVSRGERRMEFALHTDLDADIEDFLILDNQQWYFVINDWAYFVDEISSTDRQEDYLISCTVRRPPVDA